MVEQVLIEKQLKDNIISLPYVSAYSFRYFADQAWLSKGANDHFIAQLKNGIDPNQVEEGQRLYVATDLLHRFFEEIDPKIKVPYVLISGRTDNGVDDDLAKKISKNIIHWFTANNISNHPKISSIPIGLQNLHWSIDNHPQSEPRNIIKIANEDISVEKDILVSFRIQTNAKYRQPCYDYFNTKRDIVTMRMDFEESREDFDFVMDFFRENRRHKFIVCPYGNAYDCHRNWETFALGGIPIIKKHRSMEAFYDMAAWFVDDWSDVTKYSMEKNYDRIKSNWDSFNSEKIYFDYWEKLIYRPKD